MVSGISTLASAESSRWPAPACVAITGASSGLGAGLARAYARPGVMLGLSGRNAVRLGAVTEECRALGAVVEATVLDIQDGEAVAAWLRGIDGRQPIDLLIANAGISAGTRPDGRMEGFAAASEVVRTNLLGVLNTVEPLIPEMAGRGRGQIAVVASIAGLRGMPDSPAYCASKAGVLAYGESLRGALEPRGIQVSVIVPGFFVSPMSAQYGGIKLFQVSEAQAVERTMRGLRRRARRIVFPRRLALLMRLAALIPAWLGDRVMRIFSFRIAPR